MFLDATFDDEDRKKCNVDHFLAALRKSLDWELPLHVALAPLGHTDFGWYTVFPHCPRCKANAPVGRWKTEYPSEPHICQVCGNTFIPNENHSATKDDYDFESQSLKRQLGEASYDQFVKRFLEHEGCSSQQIAEIVDNEENGPILRQVAAMRRKRRSTLQTFRVPGPSIPATDGLPRCLDIELTGDARLELVLVPAGEFLMGSPASEDGHGQNEEPQHVVTIRSPFYLGRFPITEGQWKAITGKARSRINNDLDLPVDRVGWLDCQEFCNQLCKRLKKPFRLPSEAEWEYACRAGTTTAFAFGEKLLLGQATFTPMEEMMSGTRQDRTTTPVGSFPPNAWGLYDMHGNVNEWCEDVWHDNYAGSPVDGSAWLYGEDKQAFRVVRGGWCSAAETVCRSAARQMRRADFESEGEDDMDGDPLFHFLFTPYGFRVVCEIG